MRIEKKHFGTLASGEDVSLYILKAGDFLATFTDYGATWVSFIMPDAYGSFDDILLGFSTFSGYTAKHPYFGSTVGRFANRIGGAEFTLDGKHYKLWANNNKNHLHGGRRGFDKYLWNAELSSIFGDPALKLTRESPDGEEGYPGTLAVELIVSLSSSGSLRLRYQAKTNKKTLINLTNHAYFNLAGEGNGSILDHELLLHSSMYLSVDNELIPTGEITSVDGTPLDFRTIKPIGKEVGTAIDGFDFCYIIDKEYLPLKPFALIQEPKSGRRMTVATTLPAVQFYTGNNLNGIAGKRGSIYSKYSGFCLETQMFPDSPHHSNFPSAVLEPGENWEHETIYTFDVKK